jgi:hypothetical protein
MSSNMGPWGALKDAPEGTTMRIVDEVPHHPTNHTQGQVDPVQAVEIDEGARLWYTMYLSDVKDFLDAHKGSCISDQECVLKPSGPYRECPQMFHRYPCHGCDGVI